MFQVLTERMSSSSPFASFDSPSKDRPKFPSSRSFTRLEATPRDPPRPRASTLQAEPIPEIPSVFENGLSSSPTEEAVDKAGLSDTVVSGDAGTASPGDGSNPNLRIPQTFDELPIELRSLTERFLESLSAKAHPSPVSIDALSNMFQDFYTKAENHISTHIAAISTQLSRERSLPGKTSGKSSARSSLNSSPRIGTGRESPTRSPSVEQQMLSATEITDRRKARRILEIKRTALEELIERATCEKVYDKIWRHRTSEDEERDQKLRSRIAALSLVGIGLKELLAGADEIPDQVREKTIKEQDKIRDLLSPARQSLRDMSEEKYPLGKLQRLNSTHKNIVETLSQLFPSTSSADEILPTLIYTLMTSSPELVNVISDLKFIQRFRGSSKVDGEAAYCMVNLEAAIAFLETVDLSSLRSDELPEGPEKPTSRPTTPRINSTPMELGITPVAAPTDERNIKPSPSDSRAPRRLSNLISTQTNRLEAASDSFRTTVLDGADQALDTINSTLENSFKFLFGRLKEQQAQGSPIDATAVMPKTLEDARKLVSTPPPANINDDASTSSALEAGEETPNTDATAAIHRVSSGDRMLELVGGRRLRDRSVDSTKSGGSTGKRVSFGGATSLTKPQPTSAPSNDPLSAPMPSAPAIPINATSSPSLSPANAIENMRNLTNTLNPLNQFSRLGFFGRTTSSTSVSSSPGQPSTPQPQTTVHPPRKSSLSTGSTTTAAAAPNGVCTTCNNPLPAETSTSTLTPPSATNESKTAAEIRTLNAASELRTLLQNSPPQKRFVDAKSAAELRLGEVEELLKEYQRLVASVGKVVAG